MMLITLDELRLEEAKSEAQREAAQEILDRVAYLDSDDEAWIRQRFGLMRSAVLSRTGKRQIAGWFSEELWRELRHIAVDEHSSTQEILREALNDFLAKRHKPKIA
jgi:antitoxin-like ribbon-helix-helix protein